LFAHQGNTGAFTSSLKPILKVAANDQYGTFALFLARLKLQLQCPENTAVQEYTAAKAKKGPRGAKKERHITALQKEKPRRTPGEIRTFSAQTCV